MDDLYYDQGWRRRQNRFESLDNVDDYCNVGGAVRRGNSASCISRQYRPDYFVNPQSQFDNGPSFRESYAPHSIYESGRLQRAYDNQNLGGDNYTYYSHHNTPSRVNTMRNIPRGRRNSAVHTFYDAPVRSNIYDQNNFIRENDRPALFVTPIKAIAFDRDVIGCEPCEACNIFDTPNRSTAQRKNNSREPYRFTESCNYCDECCSHSPHRSNEGDNCYCHTTMPTEPISPSRAFKEDVMKVVKPIFDDIRSKGLNAKEESKAFVVAPEQLVASKPKESSPINDDIIIKINKQDKAIENINKALSQQPNIIKKLDSLTDMCNSLKDSKDQPCKCKGVPHEETKKIDAKVGSMTESLKNHDGQIQQIVKEISTLKKKDSGAQTLEVQGLENKIKKLELLQADISAKYDSLAAKLELTNKGISQVEQNCDKKIKLIKIPDIDKLNFVSSSTFEAFGHSVEEKITEMDEQMAKSEQSHNKLIKDIEKKIKDIKVPDLDKLKLVTAPMMDSMASSINSKINEIENLLKKSEQNQSKSLKDLDKKIKEIRVPDIDMDNVVTKQAIDSLAAIIDKKIDETESLIKKSEQNQNKSIKELDSKIKQIKVPDIEKLNFATKPMLDNLIALIDKKTETIEQSQNKSIKEIDKRVKGNKYFKICLDTQDYIEKSKGSKENENIQKEINDLKKYILKIETSIEPKANKADLQKLIELNLKSINKKDDQEEIKILKNRVDNFDNQMKDIIKNETDYVLKRVKDAIDILRNEYDKKHEDENNEISKIKTLFNLQAIKNKENPNVGLTDLFSKASKVEEQKMNPIEQKQKMNPVEQMQKIPESKSNAPEIKSKQIDSKPLESKSVKADKPESKVIEAKPAPTITKIPEESKVEKKQQEKLSEIKPQIKLSENKPQAIALESKPQAIPLESKSQAIALESKPKVIAQENKPQVIALESKPKTSIPESKSSEKSVEPKSQNVAKPVPSKLQDMSSNVLQRVGKAIVESVGGTQIGEPDSTENINVGVTAIDLRKYKKRAIKQIEEIEMQTLQTMGMLQFNSDSPSPFEDDIVSEAKFKEWIDRVKLARTFDDIKKIGKEIEEETGEEFISVVFSKDAQQDEEIDLNNEYRAFNILDEEVVPDSEDDEVNNYRDDFDDE